MALRLVQFLATMLTALALVPGGAHLAALPNKMPMTQIAYFTAQQIYAGWALFGIILVGALASSGTPVPKGHTDFTVVSSSLKSLSRSPRGAPEGSRGRGRSLRQPSARMPRASA
jgi:hypothetical protein